MASLRAEFTSKIAVAGRLAEEGMMIKGLYGTRSISLGVSGDAGRSGVPHLTGKLAGSSRAVNRVRYPGYFSFSRLFVQPYAGILDRPGSRMSGEAQRLHGGWVRRLANQWPEVVAAALDDTFR